MPKDGNGRGLGKGGGRGKNDGGGFGVNGDCVCPKCGTKQAHSQGIPCTSQNCPKCGNKMVREELLNK